MQSKYILSFTAASLLAHESQEVANAFLQIKDWEHVQKEFVDNNLLQRGTVATRKREFNEIKKRLLTLTTDQLAYFQNANSSEIKLLSFLGCLKLYGFIFDFVSEIMRNKILMFDYQVLNSDYESFYDSKALSHDNLNSISEATQKKLKQVLFKILEQSEMIDSIKNRNIQKPYLPESMIKLIITDDSKYLKGFLYSDSEINEYIQRFK